MKAGIIGRGIVGVTVYESMLDKSNCKIVDPKYSDLGIADLTDCDIIFVSVPTPFDLKTGEFDSTILDNVMRDLSAIWDKKDLPAIVIKSAVPPRVVKKYEFANVVISPEYLTEKDHMEDFINSKVMVLGGYRFFANKVEEFFKWHTNINKDCIYGYCSAEEAALIKYMSNCFLATKNVFLNQFKGYYDAYFEGRGDFNMVMKLFHLDTRMGDVHFKKRDYTIPGHDGDIGYGGKCLPKDVKTMMAEDDKVGGYINILKHVDEYNEGIRTNKNWLEIPGAVQGEASNEMEDKRRSTQSTCR